MGSAFMGGGWGAASGYMASGSALDLLAELLYISARHADIEHVREYF